MVRAFKGACGVAAATEQSSTLDPHPHRSAGAGYRVDAGIRRPADR